MMEEMMDNTAPSISEMIAEGMICARCHRPFKDHCKGPDPMQLAVLREGNTPYCISCVRVQGEALNSEGFNTQTL